MDHRKHALAVKKFHLALHLDPGNVRAARRLAVSLSRLGEVEEAMQVVRRLALTGHLTPVLAHRLGETLATKQGSYAAALELFRWARLQEPAWETPRLCEAHCLLNMGETSAALQVYEEVSDRASDPALVAEARIGIAKALEDCGQHREAVAVAEKLTSESRLGLLPREVTGRIQSLRDWLRGTKRTETEHGEETGELM